MNAHHPSLARLEMRTRWLCRLRTWAACALLGAALTGTAQGRTVTAAEPSRVPTYNRDIRPILVDMCFSCHGADSAARKADLRLDQRDAAIARGALVPADAGASELIRRILSTDPAEVMPPPESKKQVTPEQREMLARWIDAGAQYEAHWAFIAPVRPTVPDVKDPAWCRSPIDRFVLARLEQEGLTPAPEADKRALARRVSLDLTGLPPSVELVDAFVANDDPKAYEQLVDTLLAMPEWGEHRARYWLDYARYADTHGIHFDNYREMWSFREWVINAFNRNQPFDQFTIEQLAGDLLPNRTLEQQIGSGFNRCNITTNEGGAISEEYLVLYARDRTETTAQVWLGLTANCATCHDHKFDPLSQREFYQLSAFFNNTVQQAMDGNIHNTPPVTIVPRPEDRQRYLEVQDELARQRQALAERRQSAGPELAAWVASTGADGVAQHRPVEGLICDLPLQGPAASSSLELPATLNGQATTIAVNSPPSWVGDAFGRQALQVTPETEVALPSVGRFDSHQPFTISAWVRLDAPDQGGAIVARMDNANGYRGWDLWLEGNRVGMHLVDNWPAVAAKAVAREPLPVGVWTQVTATYDGSTKGSGLSFYYNGVRKDADVHVDTLGQGSILSDVPFRIGRRELGERLPNGSVNSVRLYQRALSADEALQLARLDAVELAVRTPEAQRSPEQQNTLLDWWLATIDQTWIGLNARLAQLTQEDARIVQSGTVAHVMQERGEPAMAYVLNRGEYDQRRDEVRPATPAVLPPLADDLPRDRLGLARWLVAPEHPLTARVTVNRFWQEVFGTGIVRTSGDFGIAGELPSHPELLDWLAVDFRESGWDIKHFFRELVLSSTYRQAAVMTPEKLERDPTNRLFSRGPRFRMDAESVRDYALAASGLLTQKLGGPSVKPYQPEGVWEAVAMIGSNTRDYKRDQGSDLYRRSLYIFWKRSAPPAILEVFNAPSRETCTVRRERTNTPLQALATMNDEQYVEAARGLAQHVFRATGATDDETIAQTMAKRVLCRSLTAEELPAVLESVAALRAHYSADVEAAKQLTRVGDWEVDTLADPVQLATWTLVANELLNLDEALCK